MTSSMRLFGMMRPTNRMFVQSSSNSRAIRSLGGRSRCEKSGTTGSTPVGLNPSASSSWRLNSESPSARSTRARIDAQLAASLEALFDELLVHVDEELGRRDVVVHEDLAVGKRVGDARGARPDREVVNQDVRRVALLDQVAVVDASAPRGAGRPSGRRSPIRTRRRRSTRWMPSTSWPMASP